MLDTKMALHAAATRFLGWPPFILSHLITSRCNADCQTCLWKIPAAARAEELSTAEAIQLYREAAQAGFQALVLWGGEPLLRKDCGDLLHAAQKAGLKTTLITNGWYLAQQAHTVLPWTDRLMVSVDALGAEHDAARRCPGLFTRLDEGLRVVRQDFPEVFVIINVVLSRLNAQAVEAIAEYGAPLAEVVSFQGMNETDYGHAFRQLDLQAVKLSAREETQVAQRIAALRQRGFRLSDSGAYLSRLGLEQLSYRCHFKKVALRVESNGDVLDCTQTGVALANVRHESLRQIVKGPAYRDLVRRAESCSRCRDFAVVEISNFWEGKGLWHAFRNLR